MDNFRSAQLRACPLFKNIDEEELSALLFHLSPLEKTYHKGEYLFYSNDVIHSIAILMDGELTIQSDDVWGNRSILNIIGPGDIFAEAYALREDKILNDVVANKESTVIFLDIKKVLSSQNLTLFTNLLTTLARKNAALVRKLDCLSKRTTREKILYYLSFEAQRIGSFSFTIAFNREQLASFLSVDRAALSRELSKLRDEGLMEYRKNHFTLKL